MAHKPLSPGSFKCKSCQEFKPAEKRAGTSLYCTDCRTRNRMKAYTTKPR